MAPIYSTKRSAMSFSHFSLITSWVVIHLGNKLNRTMYTCYAPARKIEVSIMQKQKTVHINIRTSRADKAILQQAASSVNKTVSEFLLDAGLLAASEVLVNRSLFALNDDQWDKFQAALDTNPKSKPALKQLLSRPSLFD